MLTEAVVTAEWRYPGVRSCYGNLAATFLEQGDFAPAIASFERALRSSPDVALTNFGKASYCARRRISRAIEMYKRALEIEPTYLDALLHGNVRSALTPSSPRDAIKA